VRQKLQNTTKKSYDQIEPMVLPTVYTDRRLYNEKSFDGDVVIPVKTIEKQVEENLGDFVVGYHFMMRNQPDSSSFTYGKTILKKVTDVEKKENKISKTQDKFNKRFLSRANFSYDLKGQKVSTNQNQNMDLTKKHVNDDELVLQQASTSSSQEQIIENSEEALQWKVAETKKKIAAKRAQFLQKNDSTSSSSHVEKFTGSHDPKDGFSTIDNEIETKMESIKNQEVISDSSVCKENETLAAIAALSAQVANLTRVIEQQSQELAKLRNELAEKDREIQALKEQPKKEVKIPDEVVPKENELKEEDRKIETPQEQPKIVPKEDQPSTSKAHQNALPPKEEKSEQKKAVTKAPKMPARAKTMPVVSKFRDDGVKKLVNMETAETPAQKFEVIQNTLTLPEKVRQRAVNQEVRPVNAERVGEQSFSEKLAAGLARSKSSIRWTPKQVQKDLPPRPKGIQVKTWQTILRLTPETLENWEAKRKVKIFEQYKRLFYAQHVKLELQWKEAAVKAKTPRVLNDWLTSPGKVVALLRKEQLENVLEAIQEWRNKAATYIPKGSKIAADWAKTPLPERSQ
jgi:hypothetical protein